MNPFKLDINETTKFLLPIVSKDTTYDELVASDFEQAYIGMLDDKQYDDKIVLKFKDGYSNEIELHDNIKELYEDATITTLSSDLLVLDIPADMEADYERFLEGHYSKLSDVAKANITEFWGEEEGSLLHNILWGVGPDKNALKSTLEKISLFTSKEGINLLYNNTGEFWPPPNIIMNELLFE